MKKGLACLACSHEYIFIRKKDNEIHNAFRKQISLKFSTVDCSALGTDSKTN